MIIYVIVMDNLKSLICDVGFPIVAFMLMFYFSFVTVRTNTAAINRLSALVEKYLSGSHYRQHEKDFQNPD